MSRIQLIGLAALVFLAPIVFVLVQHRDSLTLTNGQESASRTGELLFFTAPG